MPVIHADGLSFNVEIDGPADAPAIMLSNSMGTTLRMWDAVVPALTSDYRVIRYDARGHGGSSVPAGPYSVAMLARDALGILDALKIGKVNWCGLSIGGMVGQWLGANAPDRFERIVLANTTSCYADPSIWHQRIATVREGGIASIAERAIAGWLKAGFREKHPDVAERMKAMLLASPADGYIACCQALSVLDQRDLLPKIARPTLVIAGSHDVSAPLANAEFIVKNIPGARLVILDAAHISAVEQPQDFSREVLNFLK